jgi:hypothetical protein
MGSTDISINPQNPASYIMGNDPNLATSAPTSGQVSVPALGQLEEINIEGDPIQGIPSDEDVQTFVDEAAAETNTQ